VEPGDVHGLRQRNFNLIWFFVSQITYPGANETGWQVRGGASVGGEDGAGSSLRFRRGMSQAMEACGQEVPVTIVT